MGIASQLTEGEFMAQIERYLQVQNAQEADSMVISPGEIPAEK